MKPNSLDKKSQRRIGSWHVIGIGRRCGRRGSATFSIFEVPPRISLSARGICQAPWQCITDSYLMMLWHPASLHFCHPSGSPFRNLQFPSFAERRQDGDGRGVAHGGHGALLGGAAGRHAAALDGRRRPGVLLPLQRVPAQRLGQIVSTTAYKSRLESCL